MGSSAILLVEDEEPILLLLKEGLEAAGFVVAMAGSGEEAVAMLDADQASYSGLITDISLRGEVTGWDVARHSREVNEKIAVIYMTGGNSHEWASMGVPKSQLLSKPFAVAQVVTAVAQLINDETNIL